MKYIVNLSGGKDSTALLLMLLERDAQVDYIVFADTGKDFPQMHAHLGKLTEYIKAHYPTAPEITTLKADKSFDYLMFDHIKTKGKRQGTAGYGWATMLARWCTAQLKTAVINKFCNSLDDDYINLIGIAADEPKRLRPDPRKAYPFADWGITEAEALQYCYDRGFDWGGLYKHFDRVSCWCCPLKNLRELKTLWRYYPDLRAELKDMDARAYNQFRADYSVAELEARFYHEEAIAEIQTTFLARSEKIKSPEIKTVFIPACDQHEGTYGVYVKLLWVCPVCGQPRGQTNVVRSYDGSRVLFCDGWKNVCGHVDNYDACRKEAAENGLNNKLAEGGGNENYNV